MNAIFRLNTNFTGFENFNIARKFFIDTLPTRDDNYFFNTKKLNQIQPNDTIYFLYSREIIAKAKFLGKRKIDTKRDENFIHGHKVEVLKVFNRGFLIDIDKLNQKTTRSLGYIYEEDTNYIESILNNKNIEKNTQANSLNQNLSSALETETTYQIKTQNLHLSFSIDFANIEDFVSYWSSRYSYQNGDKYDDNINEPLTESSIMELFEWKNGSVLSAKKEKSVKDNYLPIFSGNKEDRYLNPYESGGAIWNIFYLHCLDPDKYPIFDQHTLRAMKYMQTKEIINTDISDANKYKIYKNEYIPFINSFSSIDKRTSDKALFAFGQFLKRVDEMKI